MVYVIISCRCLVVRVLSVDTCCLAQVLTEDTDEDAQSHASKLLEVVLIQYKGQIDEVSLLRLVYIGIIYSFIHPK